MSKISDFRQILKWILIWNLTAPFKTKKMQTKLIYKAGNPELIHQPSIKTNRKWEKDKDRK